MTITKKQTEDGYTITASDGINQVNFNGTITLWSYEVSGEGETENEAIKELQDNLKLLQEKIKEVEL